MAFLLIGLIACDGEETSVPAASATPDITAAPTQTITPTDTPTSPPTSTPTPTIPAVNDFGYPQMLDDKGHLMVQIPAGEFIMGLTREDADLYCQIEREGGEECTDETAQSIYEEYPAHPVTLTHAYWMDVYEASNTEFKACAEAGVCDENLIAGLERFHDPEQANLPVLVSFDGAVFFCEQWRGGRLPTEAEWEYAARGTDGRMWPWGTASTADAHEYMNYHPYFLEAVLIPLQPVDSYPDGRSPFGLYNMAGNVSEFVSDWFEPYPIEHVTNPIGPLDSTYRVKRGGSVGVSLFGANAFQRGTAKVFVEGSATNVGGIRCVKEAAP